VQDEYDRQWARLELLVSLTGTEIDGLQMSSSSFFEHTQESKLMITTLKIPTTSKKANTSSRNIKTNLHQKMSWVPLDTS
jgi:hypothetical protein